MEHYRRRAYRSDDDYVFCHPTKGSAGAPTGSASEFLEALAAAGIDERIRLHDLRHAALTNLAATGASPIAVMATAGHRSMQTTKQYVHLAGVVFHDDAARSSRGCSGYKIRVQTRRKPCRQANPARASASSGRSRPSPPRVATISAEDDPERRGGRRRPGRRRSCRRCP